MQIREQIPDTLDLTDRAKLVQHYFIHNPDQDYRPHFSGKFLTDPPFYAHSCWDFGDVTGRFVEGFILNRLMVGDDEGMEVENKVRDFMISLFREDGLSYRGYIKDWDPSKEGDMFFWDQGRVLYGLVTWFIKEGDPKVKNYIQGMLKGLKKVAVYEDDYAHFPYESMYQGKYIERQDMSQSLWAATGQPIEPLVRYYEATGDREALEFAGQLVRGLLKAPIHFFEPSGAFTLHEAPYHFAFHVHSHTAALIGLLHYAIATGDEELIGLGQRAYDWIKKHSSTSFGWTCEHYPYKTLHDDHQEVCCMTDILNLAILLAEAGYERYWNDVERICRNHLLESQITSIETFEPFRVGLKHLIQRIERVEDGWCSYSNILERTVGCTTGGGWANEMYTPVVMGPSGCCSPHMNKGFYLAWSHIITRKPGQLQVNLSLNFNSPWLEICSFRPYQGKIEVILKEDAVLSVRVPDWVDKWKVKVSANGTQVPFGWMGDYVQLGGVRNGQKVTVEYPLRQEWIREDVGTASFDFKWRGDTVVEVKPKGMVIPIYQRTYLDRDELRLRSQPLRCAPEEFHLW
ncbi:MAG TPA: hypothetical protein EYP53_07020 [Candidatus Latescibacteria bacterium]|nr:hypothetical protein [Candidatus Latescibacterota bacterium]